jgi:ketosteroid isomerase-like protein
MDLQEIGDRLALRELVDRYAAIPDDRDYALVDLLFTEDAVLWAPEFRLEGRDAIREAMRGIERYEATLHAMHQQRVEIDGANARGEVYCVANHIERTADGLVKLDWGIRYRDRYRRSGSGWRIAARELRRVWEQRAPLAPR